MHKGLIEEYGVELVYDHSRLDRVVTQWRVRRAVLALQVFEADVPQGGVRDAAIIRRRNTVLASDLGSLEIMADPDPVAPRKVVIRRDDDHLRIDGEHGGGGQRDGIGLAFAG